MCIILLDIKEIMSEGEKKKDEKKNTDQWKLKQEEKKKKKEGELTQGQKEST